MVVVVVPVCLCTSWKHQPRHICGYPGLGSTFVAHLAFRHLLLLGYDIHVHVQVAVWGWLGQIWSHFLWFGFRGIYIIMGLGFQGGG